MLLKNTKVSGGSGAFGSDQWSHLQRLERQVYSVPRWKLFL